MHKGVDMRMLSLVAVFAAFATTVFGVDWSAAERVSDGIELVRLSYEQPRLMKAQAMRVDLSDKTLGFTANGRDERWGKPMPYYTNLTIRTRRVTVEEFMMNARAPTALGGRGLDMLVAFNTALWTPCPEPIPTPYGQTYGLNISDGVVVSSEHSSHVKGIFAIWKNGGADILPTPMDPARIPDAWIAHSGWDVVLKDGKPLFKPDGGGDVHPRTALGLSHDRRWFYVLVVEGRHEGVSIGADYWDLANIMLSLGASDAVNMDGGGSTALVRWDEATQRQVTCLTQDVPPRRDALCIGIYRRHPEGESTKQPLDDARRFETAIDADRERCAGIYHHYEFEKVHDTPPPEGYKPFYITHYGRHGSRYQCREVRLRAYDVMKKADEAGILDEPGKVLLRRLKTIVDVHKGMLECLAERGAKEQTTLARRMYDRFPEVFSGGGKVRCQSSTKYRCLTGMSYFSCILKGAAPQLDFDFVTGERYMDVILHRTQDMEKIRPEIDKLRDKLLSEMVPADRLIALLFKNSPVRNEIVESPQRFVADLFAMATACQSLSHELGGLDIDDFFTRDEWLALARYKNCKYYVGMGNSEEFGTHVTGAAKNLVADFVRLADDAIDKGGVCADLRFGHDSGLLPFAGLVGLEGPGDRMPVAESWKRCPLWYNIPMSSNVQIVLYRKDGGDDLVKVLYNERETSVRGLTPMYGPYYRWKDFRNHLVKLSTESL